MALKCVNISHPEFKKLQEETGMESFALEMAVADYQNTYGMDDFPPADHIKRTESSIPEGEDLDAVILSLLSGMGFRVESLDRYNEVTGRNLQGDALVDMFRKVIAVADGKQGDLPEEFAHIVIEQEEGTYELDRAIKLVKKTPEYQEHYQRYVEKYSDSTNQNRKLTEEQVERLAHKEILGKLLGKHLIKNHARDTDKTLMGFLRRMWNNVLEMFKGQSELSLYLDHLARKALGGNVTFQKGEDVMFSLPGIEESEDFLNKALESIKQKNRLEKQSMVDPKLRRKKRLSTKRIQKKTEEGNFVEAILETIRFVKQDMKAAVEYVRAAKAGGQSVDTEKLSHLRAFISYYQPLMDEIKLMLDFDILPIPDARLKQAIFNRLDTYSLAFAEVGQFERRYNELEVIRFLRKRSAKEHGFDINDPDLDAKIKVKTGLDVYKEVKVIHRDSNLMQTWFGSLREVGDNILNLVYTTVKRIRSTITGETIDWGQEYLRKARDMGFLGKNLSWMYEKDNEGKYTGNFIQEYYYEAHEEALNEFRKEKHEEYGFPEDFDERRAMKEEMRERDDPALRAYNREMALWFATNTMPIPDPIARIEEMERTLDPREYAEWRYHNVVEYTDSSGQQRMYFKGELVTPTDGRTRMWGNQQIQSVDWRNHEHMKLSDNQKEFLEYTINKKKEIDIEIGVFNHGRAPQLTESTVDIVYNMDADIFKRLGRQIKETYTRVEEDKDVFGLEETYRPDGSIQRYLPKRYISKLDDPNTITRDALSAMISYFHMASEYKNFGKSVHDLEAIQTQLGRRTFKGSRKIKPGTETQYYKQLSKFLEMNVYGQHKKDINVGGYSMGKVFNTITNWVRNVNLGWNFFTSLSGYFQATGRAAGEAYVGEHYSASNYTKAYADFFGGELMEIVLETGNAVRNNKLGLFMLRSGVWTHQNIFDNLDKDRLTKVATDSAMYWSFELADLAIKGPTVMAVLRDTKVVDGKVFSTHQLKTQGKNPDDYPSVWDETSVQNGKLVSNLDNFEIQKVLGRMEYIANNLDGRLSNEDRAAAHQHAIANMLTTHRGWLIDGIQKRFKRENYNYMTGQKEVGYYRVLGDFLKKTFLNENRRLQFRNLMVGWEQLSDTEKKAVRRAAYEYVQVIGALVLAKVTNNWDEDEDNWETNALAYLTNRILVEMGSFAVVPPIGIAEFANTLQNPIMVAQKIELLIDIGDFFSTEDVKSGPYKGMAKRERAILRLLPIVKNMYLLHDPKATNQYMKNKTLRFMY
jgi:hypothetical protein